MSVRGLPVCPDLEQLRHKAKDLLRAIRGRDPLLAEARAGVSAHRRDLVRRR